ncbi:MAG: response regulator transcription factor [Clostridia bacterium]|nr:response regulator transcription factor [Oscillospiraceae bacterium]MBQ7960552.1 response regulator transcription factor [Clostridia bacterium]
MIYFVEDDENIRKLVCYALSRDGFEVKGFALPSEFKRAMNEKLPNLILLDIMLPEEDGLQILEKLQKNEKTKNIPVIMLTAKDSEFDKVTGLDMGADDYIAKPFGMTELTSRIRAVLRRYEKTNLRREYRVGELYVNPDKHIAEVSGKEISLSFKEYSLLLMLLEAEGNVVKREDLLARVWGDFYDESRTLDVHIRKLRVKLEKAGELVQTVKNIGYKIGGKPNE